MGLFGQGHKVDPKEKVREWSSNLRKQGRMLDRQIRGIQREEAKVQNSIKDAAKKNQKDVCLILAREIINSRKAVKKMYAAKAHLNSIDMQMKGQLSLLRVSGAMEKSTQVMQSMQQLVKMPEIQATMMEMSKEMMKAGIIEEMIEDTMESALDTDDMEEEAEEEVDKILYEITSGAIGKAPPAGAATLPQLEQPQVEDEDEEDVDEMRARLEALRS